MKWRGASTWVSVWAPGPRRDTLGGDRAFGWGEASAVCWHAVDSPTCCPSQPSMASETKTTTDPDEIRRWVEAHGGRPARVRGTGDDKDPGILPIDFPGGAGEEELEPISWDEWLAK